LAAEVDAAGFRRQHGLGDCPVVLFLGQKYAYKGLGALLAAARESWDAAVGLGESIFGMYAFQSRV